MNPQSDTASKSVVMRLIGSVSGIAGARRAADLFLEKGAPILEVEAQKETQAILSHLRRTIPNERNKILEAIGGPEGMAAFAVIHQSSALRSAIDSASLVFMHAVLEDVLMECILGTMRADVGAWERKLSGKRVKVGDIKGKSYDEVLRELLEAHRDQIERESMPKKAELLIAIMRPQPDELSDASYIYSKKRLEKIDSSRHEIVHRTGPQNLPTIADDIRYMEATAFRFLTMTAFFYNEDDLIDRLLGLPTQKPGPHSGKAPA